MSREQDRPYCTQHLSGDHSRQSPLQSRALCLDHDREPAFDQLYEFITATRLESFLISVPTPFPGTKMTLRMEEEGRVLSKDWSRYDMSTVVFKPANFTPEELQQKMDEDPAFKSAFFALTPGRQRGYMLYFSGAKQSKTRTARIEKYTAQIFEGKGLHDR